MVETTTPTATELSTKMKQWQGGVVAGLVGGALFGILLTFEMRPAIESAIPALFGLSGGLWGWIVHMSIAAVLGVVFAAILTKMPTVGRDMQKNVAVGLAYGFVLWVVLAVFVMPVWLDAVGFAGAPVVPNVNYTSLLGHLVYGAAVGAVYPLVTYANMGTEARTGTQPQ
ncbi:histidine kinase [Haloarchaeobius sp. DFWS5]|uniref:histidine kinase n=1 Tax=Haloarchaeobius sp. DFWS5 TaxID=3446114 RepID=UPI003EBC2982